MVLAEGVGLEPTRGSAPTRSPGVRLEPLGHPSERARPYSGCILEATVARWPPYGAPRLLEQRAALTGLDLRAAKPVSTASSLGLPAKRTETQSGTSSQRWAIVGSDAVNGSLPEIGA